MDLGIEDRVAVITGAASGIGLATAELLVHEHCRVLLTDKDGVDWGPCEQAMLDVGGPSGAYRIVAGDLTKQSDCDNVCDVAVNEFGSLDIVVHTAGVTGAKGDPLELTDQMMQKRANEQNVELDQAVQSFLKEERPGIAIARRGQPKEVAAVIALLVSDRASFINGSNYRVDGGSVQTVDN